jgi:hypothetical protein
MVKRILPVFLLSLLVVALTGCNATFANLTPRQQLRNTNNFYIVEVQFNSRQQTLRWDSIEPQIMVGSEFLPMRATPLMTNRWEGLIPLRADQKSVQYRYKFNYKYNQFGPTGVSSAISPTYTLRIIE